jgi:hypothetical protein
VAVAAARRRRPSLAAVLGVGLTVAYELALAPRLRRWGASDEEVARALPGDELTPQPGVRITHAITVAAPVEEVWPWLAQIGQDRGGFYSYEWLENLAGCRMRNADRIHPEWQHRELGEPVPLHPAAPGLAVTMFEPGRLIGLEGWGVFLVEPRGEDESRVIIRGQVPRGLQSGFYRTLLEIPHTVMERKMLLGIKERAERDG